MDGLITVDVHYHGLFIEEPLKYIDLEVVTVNDVNFGQMDYDNFTQYLRKLVRSLCEHTYYCIPKKTMYYGLRKLKCDLDYQQFLQHAYRFGRISIFVDINGTDLTNYMLDDDQIQDCSDEELSEGVSVDHEPEDDIIKLKTKTGDPFCTEVVVDDNINDDATTQERQDDIVYPTYNPSIPWRTMIPIVGMKFHDPKQLKECLTNYAVANGYGLWYEKNDCRTLLVRCGSRKNKTQCPFRLWATWMTEEHSFQIKTLISTHNCARNLHLRSLVTYGWIADKYSKTILENPDISYRALQKDIREKYNLKVSVSECQRAKKAAIGEIESKLKVKTTNSNR